MLLLKMEHLGSYYLHRDDGGSIPPWTINFKQQIERFKIQLFIIMEKTRKISSRQIAAVKRGVKLGRILQKDHPEITELYLTNSLTQMEDILDIQSEYGVSRNVA